jgi:hypothetical protein
MWRLFHLKLVHVIYIMPVTPWHYGWQNLLCVVIKNLDDRVKMKLKQERKYHQRPVQNSGQRDHIL